MPPTVDTFDPSVERPRWRAWLHQVLANLWKGEPGGYLPERLHEQEANIPALTLGALANVYILAKTNFRTCESLWQPSGALHIEWMRNGQVFSGQMCFNAQMGLQDVLEIDYTGDNQQPECDITEFAPLGGPENDDMATKLSDYIEELKRRFNAVSASMEDLSNSGQVGERLENLRTQRRSMSNAIRLPIAGFVHEHQRHKGPCCGGKH